MPEPARSSRHLVTLGAFAALALAPTALPSVAIAQQAAPALRVYGSNRIRYETISNQFRPGFADHEDILAVRTVIGAEARLGRFRFTAELWDSRVYGDRADTVTSNGDVDAVEPVQAYVTADLREMLGAGSQASVRAGRFTLDMGSRRLVASDDYRNTTNAYTGVRADIRTRRGETASLFYVLPQARLPNDPPLHPRQCGRAGPGGVRPAIVGHRRRPPKHARGATAELSYYRFAERDEGQRRTRDRRLHNVGARLFRAPAAGRADFEVEGIYQFGSISSSTLPTAGRQDVSATFVRAQLGYTVPGPARLRLSVEYDRGSGDGPGPTYGRFDPLFGMRRADFSPSGLYNGITRSNLSSPGLRAEVAPSVRWDGFLSYRLLWAADRRDAFATTGVRDASGAAGGFAGHQLDARARYWIIPRRLRAEANATLLLARDLLVDAPVARRNGDTFYASLALITSF